MQRYRAVILIVLLGVVPVVAAFFAALAFLGNEAADSGSAAPDPVVVEAPSPPPPEMREVLAAARTLPVGSLLGDEDVATIELELAAVRSTHVVAGDGSGTELLHGYAVREEIARGQAVAWPMVVGPGQRGFLAAVLGPGMRAVTIRVGPATSHAGLVDPGDRVDVILSAGLVLLDRERTVLARTIVEDVRVLAVDRWVGDHVEGSGGEEQAERTEIVTATLEVTPAEGDRLVLGGHEGVLSLAVRSLAAAPRAPPIRPSSCATCCCRNGVNRNWRSRSASGPRWSCWRSGCARRRKSGFAWSGRGGFAWKASSPGWRSACARRWRQRRRRRRR